MTETTEEIRSLFSRLADLYDKHLVSFNLGSFPDIETQTLERKEIFDTLLKKDGIDNTLWQSEFMGLVKKNQSLREKAEQEKKSVQKKIKALSKGKDLLSAYRPSGYMKNSSKVMNIKE
ncbi:MAG: hypothetical protein A2277_15395 [Desulfobacterales bacterium RIFOXYA12_FULL_46_15]|nr:MAG: hypothetical protein A2277_15395 [Desulfobacterales bacterium RIFOXYA12_FULL_46_15]